MNPIVKGLLAILAVGAVALLLLQVGDPFGDSLTPGVIPSYSEAVPDGFSAPALPRVTSVTDASALIEPRLGVVRVADAIIVSACPYKESRCVAQALLEWVRSSISYKEALLARSHVLPPEETILYREADDAAMSVLLASLLRAEGLPARIGHTPYITFVEVDLGDEVVRLDPGCANCPLGRVRYNGPEDRIVWVS